MDTLIFYLVRSKDGKYLRSRGLNGSGEHWVTDIKKAKVYPKKQSATAQITWWSSNYPEFGVPDLIPLIATPGEPIDQVERVAISQKKKELDDYKRKLYWAEQRLVNAKMEVTKLIDTKNEIKSLQQTIKELTKK